MTTCGDQYPNDPKRNVPRDISSSAATPCSQKCLLWYNYRASSSYMTNEGTRLSIRYDGGGDVTFNGAGHAPEKVLIFSPSLHTFNGAQTEAEVIVQHRSTSPSTDGLLVCIPVVKTGAPSKASEILDAIVRQAPTEKSVSTAPSIADFNLNNLLPKAPYFTYTGPLPYGACAPASSYQYVVFEPGKQGAIAVKSSTIDLLRKAISFSYIVASKGSGVFYNAGGTKSNAFEGDGQIYIQCQPTGGSEEEVVYKETTEEESKDGTDLRFLWYVLMIIVGGVIMVVLYKIVQFIAAKLDDAAADPIK